MSIAEHEQTIEGDHEDGHAHGIDESVLRRIADSWPRRATIRTDLDRISEPEEYDEQLPDYPEHLLPFAEHPCTSRPRPSSARRSSPWPGWSTTSG